MRHLLALLVAVVLVTSSLGQSGGLINGTRGVPQPNDGTTGTTLYSTAIVNASGNAILSTTANTTVPVRIVVGGAGTTGNAVLASTGTLAPCTMDAAVASGGGNYYVIESTTTNGQCHPQSAAPAAGTWVIGFLHDATTTSGSTALVHVNGFVYGSTGGGGGSGTVSPNNGNATAVAQYTAAGGSTTVSAATNLVIGSGATSIGFFNDYLTRAAAFMWTVGGGVSAETGYIRSSNSCRPPSTPPVSFSTTAGQVCSTLLPAAARAWIVHCVIPWNFVSGTGNANVQFQINPGGGVTPTAASYFSTQLWSPTGGVFGTGQLLSTVAGTQVIFTTASLVTTDPSIYSAYIDGVVNEPSSGGTLTVTLNIQTGTATGQINSGAYCRVE